MKIKTKNELITKQYPRIRAVASVMSRTMAARTVNKIPPANPAAEAPPERKVAVRILAKIYSCESSPWLTKALTTSGWCLANKGMCAS